MEGEDSRVPKLTKDKIKVFIQSLAQEQEKTKLIEDTDLMVQYLKSHRGPEPMDQLTSPFEDKGQSKDLAIWKYLPVQQMEQCTTRGERTTYPVLVLEGSI